MKPLVALKLLRFVYEVPAKQIADYLGMSEHNYHKIERGEINLSLAHALKLSDLFAVSIDIMAKGGRTAVFKVLSELSEEQFDANLKRIRALLMQDAPSTARLYKDLN